MYKVNSPILFLVFNRLDTTMRVFEAIREAQPERLYVACDGPRAGRNEEPKVAAVKAWIMDHVDWDCEVKTLFREKNKGCKDAVSEAITWFFSEEEMGIIIEDDCLPDTSFWRFCDELLEKYKTDNRIYSIGGTSHIGQNEVTYNDSYYFTKYFHCWGWASWSRAWNTYDVSMKDWPAFRQNNGLKALPQWSYPFEQYWKLIFEEVYEGKINTWDFQMLFNVWNHDKLCITPRTNMVSNIGFNADATHTTNCHNVMANMKTHATEFPLQHPVQLLQYVKLDRMESKVVFDISWSNMVIMRIRKLLSKIKRTIIKKN